MWAGMKVKAKQREFRLYHLFLHDHESTSVYPFDQWSMAKRLNELAEDMFPEMLVVFVSPDDSGMSQWNVRFSKDRYDTTFNGETKYQMYPMPRVYSEREFRRLLPKELDKALKELDKVVIVL
jgi:hypothetical protein